MAIIYDNENHTFTLHTAKSSYQMHIGKYGYLLHTYYGKKISDDMSSLIHGRERAFSGNPYEAGTDRTFSLDFLPLEYPVESIGDFRRTAFGVKTEQGISDADLRYKDFKIRDGKYSLEGLPAFFGTENEAQSLSIVLEDPVKKLEVELVYGVFERYDLITRTAIVSNLGQDLLILQNAASTCLDFITGDFDMIHFQGRHMAERLVERIPIAHEETTIGSRRGTSSHQHNPFVIIAEHDTGEDHGMCYGLTLLYSGSFTCHVEKDQFEQTRIIMGVQDERFEYPLAPGEKFIAPECAHIFSDNGFTELSHKQHKAILDNLCRGKRMGMHRPVLINSWEAKYFDFNKQDLLGFAKEAAELGIELFVLDDGWFSTRNDDTHGLGNWKVNEHKLGGPLSEFVQEINRLGLDFGIWIEPEMVNEDAPLYLEHPDWVLRTPGRPVTRGRCQLVWDFSRPDVVDTIFSEIATVLDSANISYIKYDMNRSLCNVATHQNGLQSQGKVLYQYVLGVYRFFEMLLTRYPNVLVEGCSGGGGRFDAGMLYYTPQIWCSDNSDPIERLAIQYGTSFAYPVATMGAHVSASPNHMTGRSTPLATRAIVAMSGCFGYELLVNDLSQDEKDAIRKQIVFYKKHERLLHYGKYYRLTEILTNRNEVAWMVVSEDRMEALVSVVILDNSANGRERYIMCKGLAPEALYRMDGRECRSGAYWMYGGIHIGEHKGDYNAFSFLLEQVQAGGTQ